MSLTRIFPSGWINIILKDKPFFTTLFASASAAEVDDEVDKSFLKRRMLPREKALPRKYILNTKENEK